MKKSFNRIIFTFLCIFFSLSFASCEKKLSLEKYVSENRTGYYYAETDDFSLKAYFTIREYPYAADGIAKDVSPVAEVFLFTENTGEKINISFSLNGKTYGGEMNYDSVKKCFSFSDGVSGECPTGITFNVTYGETDVSLSVGNKKSESALPLSDLLEKVKEQKSDLIDSLTNKRTFNGEIYVRFIYDEGEYYYVGITDTNKKTTALLLDAKSGKIIAEKESD